MHCGQQTIFAFYCPFLIKYININIFPIFSLHKNTLSANNIFVNKKGMDKSIPYKVNNCRVGIYAHRKIKGDYI